MFFWIRTYSYLFILLFSWQLLTMFYIPLLSTSVNINITNNHQTSSAETVSTLNSKERFTSNLSTLFVEELHEVENHPVTTIVTELYTKFTLHFAFHTPIDYLSHISLRDVPPEA